MMLRKTLSFSKEGVLVVAFLLILSVCGETAFAEPTECIRIQGAGTQNTWAPTSTTDAPSGRFAYTAVWTGKQMIVWGGIDLYNSTFQTGGRYNPATNTWMPTSTIGAPSPRCEHTAVWTGKQMIVWGAYVIGGFMLKSLLHIEVSDESCLEGIKSYDTGQSPLGV